MLDSLSHLPPAAVYTVLALLAAVENVLPPVPSDAAVALGAFLSHRHVTTPLGVFLVTWVANLLGAAGVYLIARRYGRRLFASPTGRRLLAPRSLAIIEREYLRLGTAGIFISRFLPGIRAVPCAAPGWPGIQPLAESDPYILIVQLGHGTPFPEVIQNLVALCPFKTFSDYYCALFTPLNSYEFSTY